MKKCWHSPLSQDECLFQIKLVIGYSSWTNHWKTGLQGEVSKNKFKCWYKIAHQKGNSYKPLSGTVEQDPLTGGSIITIESKLSEFIFNKYASLAILALSIIVFILNGQFDFRGFLWGIIIPIIIINLFLILMTSLFWLFLSADKTYAEFKLALIDKLEAKEME